MNIILRTTALLFILSISTLKAQVQLKQVYKNNYSAAIGSFGGINYREGGFSGLCVIPGTEGKEFYTLTDRGVNIDAKNASCTPSYDKIYAFPTYHPKIFKVRIDGDSVQILNSITLKNPEGNGATGIINPTNFGSSSVESAWNGIPINCGDPSGVVVAKDKWGIDCEGIAIGKNNDFWICEEGGPTIWNIDANGKVKKRYSPYATQQGAEIQDAAIDTVFKYRKNNRGFEGVTITPNGKVYAIIQSPILYPNKTDGEKSYVHRIIEIDPTTGISRMFAYLNPGTVTVGVDVIKPKDWKIGDLSAINDTTFLVIEQGVVGANIQRNIYKISIKNATPITSGLYGGKTVEQLKDAAGLSGAGIVPVDKKIFIDLRANAWPDALDKCEGLTIVNDSTIALCNDNDFGQSSPLENGIAQLNNVKCSIYLYGLKGANKVPAFVASPLNTITAIEPVKTENNSSVKLYPIPVENNAYFELQYQEETTVEIYNLSGLLVQKVYIAGSSNLDLSNLPTGLYMARINSKRNTAALKFVKN